MYNHIVKTGLIVNFHLPCRLSKSETDLAVANYYAPVLKTLKNLKGSFSISMSLSFLEVLHKNGYLNLIHDIKQLVEQKKAELVDTTAYNPIMHYLSDYSMEKQIVFNEFGLGYYFGRNRDFDGDTCIMIGDLNGFYPADNCVDERTISKLLEFGYKWSVIDASLLNGVSGLYKIIDTDFYLVAVGTKQVPDNNCFVALDFDYSTLKTNNTLDLLDNLTTNKTELVSVSELMSDLDGAEISLNDIKKCPEVHGINVSAYKQVIEKAEAALSEISRASKPEADETFVEIPFWVEDSKSPVFDQVSRELMSLKTMDFSDFRS